VCVFISTDYYGCVFLQASLPPFNVALPLPRSYKVIPLAWPLEDTSQPAGVHLILEEKRWKKSSSSMLRGAALLLRLLNAGPEENPGL